MVNLNKLNSYENTIIDSVMATIEQATKFMKDQKCHKCGGKTMDGKPAKSCRFTKNKVFIYCEDSKELIGYGDQKNKRLYLLPTQPHDNFVKDIEEGPKLDDK
jgi:hypothetical protein